MSDMKHNYEIYLIEAPGYWYVGSTTIGAERRFQRHLSGRGRAPELWAKIQALGGGVFKQQILEEDQGDPIEAEQRWYDWYLVNDPRESLNGRRPGGWDGFSRAGHSLTEEHKIKIGLANKGRKPSAFAIARSIETHRGQPSPLKGRRQSEEERRINSECHKGLIPTPEAVAKRKASLQGVDWVRIGCQACDLVSRPGCIARHQNATGHQGVVTSCVV
jgi:hypothetical protein